MIRLYKDDVGEMLTEAGFEWDKKIDAVLSPLVKEAVKKGVSLRDVVAAVNDVITVCSAEERLRAGIRQRKAKREKNAK